jgi:hypothetical protein
VGAKGRETALRLTRNSVSQSVSTPNNFTAYGGVRSMAMPAIVMDSMLLALDVTRCA